MQLTLFCFQGKAGSESSLLSTSAPVFTPGRSVRPPLSRDHHESSPTKASSSNYEGSEAWDECCAAAQWWTRRMKQDGLSHGQHAAFENALRDGLLKRCNGKWYPNDVMRGSGFRSVINDLTVDPVLVAAGDSARISGVGNRLPKAVVWINPGAVRVHLSSERHVTTVFQAGQSTSKPLGSCINDSDEDASADVWTS
jgi:hypothetical protein